MKIARMLATCVGWPYLNFGIAKTVDNGDEESLAGGEQTVDNVADNVQHRAVLLSRLGNEHCLL